MSGENSTALSQIVEKTNTVAVFHHGGEVYQALLSQLLAPVCYCHSRPASKLNHARSQLGHVDIAVDELSCALICSISLNYMYAVKGAGCPTQCSACPYQVCSFSVEIKPDSCRNHRNVCLQVVESNDLYMTWIWVINLLTLDSTWRNPKRLASQIWH